ncbi:MAG: DUF2207 domain-containing protein, partial [Candidatus Krumholzibacteriota bacterium]|nr:DUF2207 domain-containing protein [Candidatus Krumholzibacteriota bacterium]
MRRILPVAMAALLLASLCGSAAAKSFQIERFHSEVELLEDGSIRVTESLTYRFDGRFKFAWRMIPLRDGVSIGNLAVAENGRPYESSSTERPGTFYTAPTAEGVRVRWFYRARNEARTFTVSYILRGAVLRHPDVTEYYHKIIGDEESPRMGHVSARVTLPNRDWYPSDLRAWAHGPLHGGITIESGRVVTAQVSPLYAGQFFEVRIVMPAGVFDNLPLQTNEPQLDRILSQEKGWADEANRRRERNAAATERYQEKRRVQREQARRWMPVAWVLAIVSVLGWVVLYRRHGTPYPVTPRSAPGAIPSEDPPAVVAQLVVSGVGGASLVATLLDLAQRGYLTVEEKTTVARGWFGRESTKKDFVFRSTGDNPGELQPFEAELLEFLFNELGDGTEFTMKGIRKAARKKRTKFRRWFMRWTKSVKKVADAEGFFEPYAVRAMVINGASGVVVGGIGVANLFVLELDSLREGTVAGHRHPRTHAVAATGHIVAP